MMTRFIPSKTYIPVSGKVFDKEEINNAIKVAKDGWWTEGKFGFNNWPVHAKKAVEIYQKPVYKNTII